MKKTPLILFIFICSFSFGQHKTLCNFTLTGKVIDSTCGFPYCNGVYVLAASGGTPPYDWSNGRSYNSIDTFRYVCPGVNPITVKDTNGCTGTTSVYMAIDQYPHIDSLRLVVAPSCDTCCNGKITAYMSGLCGFTYQFEWSNWEQLVTTDTAVCAGTSYTFCVTESNGHMSCDSIKVPDILTSVIQPVSNEMKVLVYPNPSRGVFNLQFGNESQKTMSVKVFNMLGQEVYSVPQLLIPNSQFLIDISNNPPGIYLYRITSEKGELIGSGKLEISK